MSETWVPVPLDRLGPNWKARYPWLHAEGGTGHHASPVFSIVRVLNTQAHPFGLISRAQDLLMHCMLSHWYSSNNAKSTVYSIWPLHVLRPPATLEDTLLAARILRDCAQLFAKQPNPEKPWKLVNTYKLEGISYKITETVNALLDLKAFKPQVGCEGGPWRGALTQYAVLPRQILRLQPLTSHSVPYTAPCS